MSEGKAMKKEEARPERIGPTARLLAGQLAVVVIVLSLILSFKVLNLPSGGGTLSITAVTGSLSLEPLCGESVTWDFPAGGARAGRHSPRAGRVRSGARAPSQGGAPRGPYPRGSPPN